MNGEIHIGKNIFFNINTRRHLNQCEAFFIKPKNRPLGDIQYSLPRPAGIFAAESYLFNIIYKFPDLSFFYYCKLSVLNPGFKP